MLLYPPEPKIGDDDGFTPENDIFGLREFGESLTRLVTNVDQPLVLTLDGPWGSGKSTFAKQWAGELRKRGLPVILFDAFANDHQEDAFVALSAEILAQAERLKGPKKLRDKFKTTAARAGRALLPVAAKIGIRAATLGVLSAKDLEGMGEDLEGAIKESSIDAGALLESVIQERLEQANADNLSLEAFKESLTDLATGLAAKPRKGANKDRGKSEDNDDQEKDIRPLVFIIDELDRCRPPFALSILERIKHLFSVDGVCFVLITNLEQLEAVVKGTYGLETKSQTYLNKFFHLRVRLPNNPDWRNRQEIREQYVDHLWRAFALNKGGRSVDDGTSDLIKIVARACDLHLRDLERIAGHIALVYSATAPQHLRISSIIATLAVMKLTHRELYDKASAGRLTWVEAKNFLAESVKGDDDAFKHASYWWRYALEPDLPDEEWVKQIDRSLFSYAIERNEILPYTIRLMDRFDSVGE